METRTKVTSAITAASIPGLKDANVVRQDLSGLFPFAPDPPVTDCCALQLRARETMNRVTHRVCLFLAFVVFSSAAGLSAQERGACIARVTEPTSDQGAAYDDETGCVPRQTPDSTLSPSSEWHFDLS